MQPSGRAVTTHPASLYSSARHMIPNGGNHTWSPSSPIVFAERSAGRDFTWKNGSQITFSHPAGQVRNAASRATPPPPAKRKSEYRPPPRLQYRPQASRVQKGPGQISNPNDLDSLDFGSMFGAPSATSAKGGNSHAAQTASTPLSARSTSQAAEETAIATSAAAEEVTAVEGSASNELAASAAAAAKEMAAIHGSASLELQEEKSSKQQDRVSGPLSPLDMMAALELRNKELKKSHEEARKALDEMASQESDLRSQVEDVKKTLESMAERARTREESLRKTHSDIKGQLSSLRSQTSAKINSLEQDLAFERSPRRQQDKRFESMQTSVARNTEAARQMRAKEERLATRKDYSTFRDFFTAGNKAILNLIASSGRFVVELDFLRRQAAYWSRELETFKSFSRDVKEKQRKVIFEAEDPKTKVPMTRIKELMGPWGHQDDIHRQILHYIETNISRLEQATSDYSIQIHQTVTTFEHWKLKCHALRKTMRLVRFEMDTSKHSPLMGVRERYAAICALQIERPASSFAMVVKDLANELRATKAKGGNLEHISNKTNALERAKYELRMVKIHGMLYSKLLQAEWIANQPIYQRAYSEKVAPLAYWHAELTTRTENIDTGLIKRAGFTKDSPLWQNLKTLYDLRGRNSAVETSAFKLALFKFEKNLFEKKEIEEIDAGIQRNINAASSKLREFNNMTKDLHGHNMKHVAQQRQQRRLDTAESIPHVSRRRRIKVLKSNPSVRRPVDLSETASTSVEQSSTSDINTASYPATSAEKDGITTSPEKITTSSTATTPEKDNAPTSDSTPLGAVNVESSDAAKAVPDANQASDKELKHESVARALKSGPAFRKDGSRASASERRLSATSGTSIRPRGRVLPKSPFKHRPSSLFGLRPTSRRDQESTARPADFVERSHLDGDEELLKSGVTQLEELKVEPATGISTSKTDGKSQDAFEPLLYQIPPKDLRSALMVSNTSQAAYWTYSLYKSPEGKRPTRYYCRKLDQAERVAQLFLKEKVLGFDIEWEMGNKVGHGNIKDNVSLIQIACDDRIALFQIASFYGDTADVLMPPTLKTILESPNTIKAGVNIAGDFTRLRKCLGVEGQGIFELSHLYKLVKYSEHEPTKVNKSPAKLADQVQDILFLPLSKGSVRTSPWSKELSGEQIDYACSDAYAGFRLFHALESARKAMSPMPPRPAFWECDMPIRLGNGEIAHNARKRSKAMARKVTQSQSGAVSTTAEEEQAINEEEEEAEAEAEVNDVEDLTSVIQDQPPEERLSGQLAVSSEFEKAEVWMHQWEDNLPPERKNKNLPTSIRAYALWHHQGLELGQVAEVMRQPPLALSTVASYVLEVVRSENLPSEAERLQQAVDLVPTITRWKYRGLVQQKDKPEN